MRAITMIYIQGGTKRQRELAEDMTIFMFRKFNMYPDVEIAFKRLTKNNKSNSKGFFIIDNLIT